MREVDNRQRNGLLVMKTSQEGKEWRCGGGRGAALKRMGGMQRHEGIAAIKMPGDLWLSLCLTSWLAKDRGHDLFISDSQMPATDLGHMDDEMA
jgi:hypothetical protein